MTQKEKQKFRSSKVWVDYRKRRREEDCVDFITHKKLTSGFNLHHCNLDSENYTDISNDEHFVCLNKKMHSLVHDLFIYYKKDPECLYRLKLLLDKMREINQ